MPNKKSTYFDQKWKQQIGSRIRKIRGFDQQQKELAETLGITQSNLSKIERGELAPTTENLVRLSRISGRSIDWIINGENSPTDNAGI